MNIKKNRLDEPFDPNNVKKIKVSDKDKIDEAKIEKEETNEEVILIF
jgi:hypothetical protein